MKKGILYTVILLLGVGIGFGINVLLNTNSSESSPVKVEKVIIEKVKTKTITDTLIVKELVRVPVLQDSLLNDYENNSDTLLLTGITGSNYGDNEQAEPNENPEEEPEEDIIVKDELLTKRTLKIEPLPPDSSDVSELLNLNTNEFSDRILVEFWQSPLNITGYELSRNKLKLFGFNPTEAIGLKLNHTGDRLLLNTETMSIVLEKKNQFQTLNLR